MAWSSYPAALPVGLGDASIPMGNPGAVPERDLAEEDADGEDDWETHSYHQQLQHQHQLSAYSGAYQHSMGVQQTEEVGRDGHCENQVRRRSCHTPTLATSSREPRAHSDQHFEEADSEGEGEEERWVRAKKRVWAAQRRVGANGHSHSSRNSSRTVKSPLSTSSISNASDEDHKPEAEDEESAASEEEEDDEEDPDESPSSDDDYDDDNDPEYILTTRSSRRRGRKCHPRWTRRRLLYPGGPASYPISGPLRRGPQPSAHAPPARACATRPIPAPLRVPAHMASTSTHRATSLTALLLRLRAGATQAPRRGSHSPPLDGSNAAGRTRGASAGQATPYAQSRAHSAGAHSVSSTSRGGARAPVSVPIPIPVPNLTKKSRGRRVPTMESLEDLRSAASGAGRGSARALGARGARMYLCEVEGCGKCFARGEHLKRHVRSIHYV